MNIFLTVCDIWLLSQLCPCLCTKAVIQYLLSDTDRLRGYLKKLIVGNEFKAVLKGKILRRNKSERIVRAACTGVCKVLLLADVDNEILYLRGLTDYHALVNGNACADEQRTSFLSVVKTVGNGFTRFKAYK